MISEKRQKVAELLITAGKDYLLERMGFISDLKSEIHQLLQTLENTPETFNLKSPEEIITDWYQKKKFASFISSQLAEPVFIQCLHNITIRLIRRQNTPLLELEKELYTKQTCCRCAFLRTNIHHEEFLFFHNLLRSDIIDNQIQIKTPNELEQLCEQTLARMFPLSTLQLILFLQKNKSVYWNLILPRIKMLTKEICKFNKSISEADFNDICSETLEIIRAQIQTGKFPENITSAQTFIYYTGGIIRNKTYEFLRTYFPIRKEYLTTQNTPSVIKRHQRLFIPIESIDLLDDSNNPQDEMIIADSKTIDSLLNNIKTIEEIGQISQSYNLDNELHIKKLIISMLDKKHPLHLDFIHTMKLDEKAIEILLLRAQGVSYKEIAQHKAKNPLDDNILNKEIDKLRHQNNRLIGNISSKLKTFLK